jgi:hypothetical protein
VAGFVPKAPRGGGMAGATESERPASEPPPQLCLMDTPNQGGSGRGAGEELGAEPAHKAPRRGVMPGARGRIVHWGGVPPERDRGPEAPMQRFTVKVSDSAPQVMELDSSPALIHGSGAEPLGSGVDSDEDEDEESLVPRRDLCVFRLLQARMNAMFPSYRSPTLHKQAMALVQRAYERYSFESSLERAVVAVGEFAFDKAALLRDERDFEACGGDLVEMARRCIEARKERRCNLARVRACISVDNPERALLLQFAAEGVDVRPLLPPEFVPNGPVHASWPRLSGTYARAPRLVNALLSKAFHVPGLAVILLRARITDWGGCNVSTSGWAPKPTGTGKRGQGIFAKNC